MLQIDNGGYYVMCEENIFMPGTLVWVPKIALALYSRPGRKDTKELWDIGIIMSIDNDGNIEVLVDGNREQSHTNW